MRPNHVVVEEEEDEDDEDDNNTLSWKVKKPRFASAPASTRDQARTNKGKNKICEETVEITRCYMTQGTEKKMLSDAMITRKKKYTSKSRARKTTFEDELPGKKVVKVEEETNIDWTESESELGDKNRGLEKIKVPQEMSDQEKGVSMLALVDQTHKQKGGKLKKCYLRIENQFASGL